MDEFSYISKKLSPLAPLDALNNDAYVYQKNTVITKDIIIEGVHFLKNTKPSNIAKKAIRVNLSDIAAMGAKPYGYFVGLAISNTQQEWLDDFAKGLEEDNKIFNINLLGGDTTVHRGANIISITMLGLIAKKPLLRSSAKIGDSLYVSGTIGDSALGLLTYKKNITPNYKILQEKYTIPEPQIKLGQELSNVASSCIDISDGLIQDANHICKSSKVGLEIYIDKIPFSPEVQLIINDNNNYRKTAITGGDDYQLLFTVKSDFIHKNITKIGQVIPGKEVKIIDSKGKEISFNKKEGYRHF